MDVEYITEGGETIIRTEEVQVPRINTWVLLDGSLWEVTRVALNHDTGYLETVVGDTRVDLPR